MKLNLLPTTVSKGKQAKSGIVFSAMIAVAGAIGAIFVSTTSSQALTQAKSDYDQSVGPAAAAYSKSIEADAILEAPSSVALIRDAKLADEMIRHNDVYPALYDSLKPYIPSFYRVNSMFASPTGAGTSTITLVGTIKTYQQYADLMLAFSRYPGVQSVGRAGFNWNETFVPNISPLDQIGLPHKLNEAPVPEDKFARIAYFESQVQPQGYSGVSNYGSGTDNTRGAMPDYSLVTVTLAVQKDLMVPLPRATLAATGGAASTSTAGTGLPPGVPSGAGSGIPPAATGGGTTSQEGTTRKKGKGKSDEE